MKPIERNPDVELKPAAEIPYRQQMPPGMTLVEGKNFHHTARSKGIPFGQATVVVTVEYNRRYQRKETVGLVIRDADVARFKEALALRGKYQPKKGRAA